MTSPHPQEIELKLALPPAQADAFRRRMARRRCAPDEQDLVTRYFDTPDFALSAMGVALRVRRFRDGWVQTLKTEGERQGGLSRRVEFEMPVADDALDWARFPPAALAFVPARLRKKVVAVFETRFHRSAWMIGKGRAQIEVALDIGEVRALKGAHVGKRSEPLCEIELELKAGKADALFALALEWADAFDCLPFDISKAERGVRLAHGIEAAPVRAQPVVLDAAMRVEDGFAATLQACLAHWQANLPGVLASSDVEYVHQARVALQRLRTALRLYRSACPVPPELVQPLRAFAKILGPVRDLDVLVCETLPQIAAHYPDPSVRGEIDAFGPLRAEARAAMQGELAAAHPGAWLLAMQRWLMQQDWRAGDTPLQVAPLAAWARGALQRGHRRIERDARAFATLNPEARHALRIAIKRQRYAAEFLQSLFPGDRRQAHYVAVLRDAQDALGRARDLAVARELLAAAPAGPLRDFALGWLAAKADNAADARVMGDFLHAETYW